MIKDKALKLALEALETCCAGDYSTGHVIDPSFDEDAVNEAIISLKEALAPTSIQCEVQDEQSSSQEPVAFSCLRCVTPKKCAVHGCSPNTWPSEFSPKRPWVGLNDKEIEKCYETTGHRQTLRLQDRFAVFSLARAVQIKLKEKNT